MAKKIATSRLSRPLVLCAASVLLASLPQASDAQSVATGPASEPASTYWSRFALGFAGSLAAHETAHILTALAVGSHPHFGFDKGRPTIYSGIDSQSEPHKQFLFSASGLTTQDLINELILDIPHAKGSALERGGLAGGIATTLFYVTIGRNGAVSDIAFMSRTSSLSKNQLTLIFGGVSAIQTLRIFSDPRYGHFFIRPESNSLVAGLTY